MAIGTKADRPQWQACLDDLRPGDTLIIWRIDRLGRSLRDLVDTTTAHGNLVFGRFALMAEYEAASSKNAPLPASPPHAPEAAPAAANRR
ncbi:DNA invertase Pin-like site-specific DNA recombinase [Catenuloplanes nepalensis]|uniref:DNA invertase Pin-like site-specific DNA recombinase n=1 Tax=Catenuloplanes nepalensis TaxID=587533 RepID=A0ABT9MSM6_9ACTN|nr:recombinase family protein [Catenuloplanes nepalensis]MDP9794437.1 DNA invertase Pin-like site-specific DNA recombinase [Catenuloplanes nepalensis]